MTKPTYESGRRIPMVVTFLEMKEKPSALPPPQPRGKIAILKASHPPVHFYRYLYNTIGDDYFWVDRRKLDDKALGAIVQDPEVELYVLYTDGSPAGMAELDMRDAGTGQLAYFGLMPEAVGKRLGYFFLYHAVMNAWARPITKLLVNTCTLDHPRALPLYQRLGFVPYSREDRYIELP
ncbi:MAG: GNAT family N-acetyltransferase [Alphaproteobacteria bacterium]|nr:GNAT family N-acetyltransferase [Alphaproteobacteria bacterium]MBV9541990.1 GNAT family N-acetyltransferase [Alphaproteobacteria bacterium]MBV9903047.1 GNAT family N-acetyltransferase [Alphaproteobacteria bacterium]